MTVNKNIARLAQQIRDRRQTDTAADPGAGEPSTMDLLRAVSQADSDAHLARFAKPTTTDQKEA